jgi:cytochrome c biogenesis protein CcmG, thiol:disulfide interchange protein DsbE
MNRRVLLAGLVVILPLIVVLYLNLGHDPSAVDSPLIGREAPPFTLRPVGGGEPISLAALRGKPVVLNFWASWCVPCAQEHGALTAAARSLAGRVQFLGLIYEDSEEAALETLRSSGGAVYPSLLDPGDRTAVAYGIYGVPETFFIDPGGRIVDKFVGPLTPQALDERLRRLTGAPRS